MKNTDDPNPATTNGPPRLSWAEQLSQMTKEEREKERMKSQIAFNNSPEAAEIDKQFLEMLERGQQEEEQIRKDYGLK